MATTAPRASFWQLAYSYFIVFVCGGVQILY